MRSDNRKWRGVRLSYILRGHPRVILVGNGHKLRVLQLREQLSLFDWHDCIEIQRDISV